LPQIKDAETKIASLVDQKAKLEKDRQYIASEIAETEKYLERKRKENQ
jgi:hypothetical protein